MDRNKIFKLIETIVESKSIVSSQISDSNIGNLVPIEEVYGGYMCDRAIQFTPHEDYGKGGELVKADIDVMDKKLIKKKKWRGGYRRMTFGVIWVSAHPTKFI